MADTLPRVSSPPLRDLLVARRDGAHGVGEPTRDGWELTLSAGTGRLDVATATGLLLDLCEQADRWPTGGTLRWRVPAATPEHRAIARAGGFDDRRALVQMRRALPAADPPPLETRAFVPGADDDEWLRVNNAAFDWHPEQGGWSRIELSARLAEPWVDLDGFLLHPDGPPGSSIDAFCWTKVHVDTDPLVGEIFVIAVDPDRHGGGLGRAIVLAGLDHLHRVRGAEVGMLYTEADNEPALALYRDLGFAVHHEVRVFTRQVPTPTSAPIP